MKFATCMAVVFASAVSAQAGQPVSVNSLNAVGLSNVVVMSDAQGTQVRAKGNVARTSGSSTVNSSAKQGAGNQTDGTATNSANSRSRYNGGALAGQANLSGSASGATNNGTTSASGSIAGGGAIAYGR